MHFVVKLNQKDLPNALQSDTTQLRYAIVLQAEALSREDGLGVVRGLMIAIAIETALIAAGVAIWHVF